MAGWSAKTGQHVPVRYKGRDYYLAYLGDTRHGRRAKLASAPPGNSHPNKIEFWVDAGIIEAMLRSTREGWEDRWNHERERCETSGQPWTGWRPGEPRMYHEIIGG